MFIFLSLKFIFILLTCKIQSIMSSEDCYKVLIRIYIANSTNLISKYNQTWSSTKVLDIVRPVSDPKDCNSYCSVNVGCVAWTLTSETNMDFRNHCILYSSIGERVPYHQAISGVNQANLHPPSLHHHHHRILEDQGFVCDSREFACTATFDNTQNIFYGMTQVH